MVQHITPEEMCEPANKARMTEYNARIKAIMNGKDPLPLPEIGAEASRIIDIYDDDLDPHLPHEPESSMPEADDFTPEELDKYISAEVILPNGEARQRATVLRRKRDRHGNPIGLENSNPVLDTRVYQVQFPDGTLKEYSANVIAENIYSQVDSEGRQYLLIDEIQSHKCDGTALRGDSRNRQTTKGWKFQVLSKDGSTSWVPLKDLKESFPVQTAEYAIRAGIDRLPAFVWWTPYVIRKRDRIISKVKSSYWKKTHKFGIQLPKSIEEALELDTRNGDGLWRKATEKEYINILPAFRFDKSNRENKVTIGYQHIRCHWIFDIKMDLTRKARFVAGGHMTTTPSSLTYASVVSRESVRIALTAAALNELDILMADIGNAYLNADCREKVCFTAGTEFGSRKGDLVIIAKALYGLKSSGAAWRAHLAQSMTDLDYSPCQADADVWMRPMTKPDGFEYWEYVLIYVDDIMVISHEPEKLMESLSALYRLKEDPKTKKGYGVPTKYLGADIGKYITSNQAESLHGTCHLTLTSRRQSILLK